MGRALYLLGQYANHLTRGALTLGTAAAADGPASNLYDYRTIRPYKSSAVAEPLVFSFDGQLLTNGDLALGAGNVFTGWTSVVAGTGSVVQEVATVTRCVKLDGGASGNAYFIQRPTVRAGEAIGFYCRMRGDGVASIAKLYIQDETTGKYYNGTAWATAFAPALTQAGAAGATDNGFYEKTVNFSTESMSILKSDTTRLSVIAFNDQNGPVYFDDLMLFPAVSFVSIHGHNIKPLYTCVLRSFNVTAGGSVDEATFSPDQPSFYSALAAPVYRRYWHVRISGSGITNNPEVLQIAELVLGQYQVMGRGVAAPRIAAPQTDADRAQVRAGTGAGDTHVFQRSSRERRTIHLPYLTNDTVMRQLVNELHQRSENGLYPMVIVPDSDRPDVVLGQIEAARSARHTVRAGSLATQNLFQQDVVIRELAFPQFAL